jgi:hypothetical protein
MQVSLGRTDGREKRRQARIALEVLSIITGHPGSSDSLELYSRDISAGGAFFPTDKPLSAGVKVRITVVLLVAALEQVFGYPGTVRVQTEGRVVRSVPTGMAIAFEGGYHLESSY